MMHDLMRHIRTYKKMRAHDLAYVYIIYYIITLRCAREARAAMRIMHLAPRVCMCTYVHMHHVLYRMFVRAYAMHYATTCIASVA